MFDFRSQIPFVFREKWGTVDAIVLLMKELNIEMKTHPKTENKKNEETQALDTS